MTREKKIPMLLPLEKNVVKVSHSEAESYALCKRRHYYAYGMQKEPSGSAMSDVIYRGVVLDAALNDYFRGYKDGKTPEECLAILTASLVANSNQDGKQDMVIVAELMARMQRWHEIFSPEIRNWQIISVQEDFPYTLSDSGGTEITMVALPDLVARIPGKGYCVLDYKSVRDFYPEVIYQMGTQLPKYYAAVKQVHPVAYIGFIEIRWRTMRSTSPHDYFKMRLDRPEPSRIARALHEHQVIAEDISILRALRDAGDLEAWDEGAYRTVNKNVCNYCPFYDLCTAQMRGDDTELMLTSLYQTRMRRKEILVNDA